MQKKSGNFSWVLILPCEVKFCMSLIAASPICSFLIALVCSPCQVKPLHLGVLVVAATLPVPASLPATERLLESHWNQYATTHLLSLDGHRGFQSPALSVKPGTDFFGSPPSPSMVLTELPTAPRLGWKLCFPFL